MRILTIFLLGATCSAFASEPTGVDRVDGWLSTQGKLIFQDDFNRKESDDTKEEPTPFLPLSDLPNNVLRDTKQKANT
jgi:hypothetical protein